MLIAAWVIFLVSYGVFAFGRLPKTRVDRPAMAVIGAALMFAFRVLSPANGIKSIDYATIVLLFAMMLIVAGLHLGGFFDAISHTITERLDPKHLLPGVIFTSGILSAFLVNDVVCLFMAPLVLKIVRRWQLPALPYLLALATASNIGSTATITGNPQNILIGSVSRIGYLDFMFHLGPVAVIGLFVDWGLLHLFFRR
ncbi:MAG TPA: SLC13 family permease, partial [Terriglobales bacterium]